MNARRWLAAAAGILALCAPQLDSAQAPPQPKLKDEMRTPWQRGNTRYIRWWRLSGPYACDLARDCLDIPGGEASARDDNPPQKFKNGTALTWNGQPSWGDFVGFDAISGQKDGAVAYAIAYFERKAPGAARLAVGSTDGIRVWIDGKPVLVRDGHRALTPDEDQVEVELAAGWHALLVKAEATSTFTARVLEPGTAVQRSFEIGPSIIEQQPELFTVRTDVSTARAAAPPVKVEVLAPGGDVKFSGSAQRGELLVVDAKGWPEGPYEARISTQTPAGLLYVTYLPWFKGNCLNVARELAAEAAQADATTPAGATLAMLAEMVEDRLGVKLAEARNNPWPKIHSPLMEYRELLLERAGKPARARAGGFLRIAYRDEVDGTVQFARAFLPASYDPGRKWPLVLHLHGFNPANPRYVRWWSVDSRHPGIDTEFANHEQVILIEPHGRGNTQYAGIGDQDVMRVISEAQRLLRVDEDRVYLSGESMGGFGTWNVATRHPDTFAAIAPIFGGFDYHEYFPEETLAQMLPIDRFVSEKASSWAMAENLLNVPVFVHHGDADGAVKVEWSRWGVKLLQRWGYDVRYQEYPGATHETLRTGSSNANMSIPWFLEHRRNPAPRQVRLRSAELRNASAYWVRIEQAESPLEFMSVDAEIVDRNVIRLDTANVLAVVLTPSAALVDPAQPVRVVWNGATHTLRSADGALRLAQPDYRPASLRKHAQLPGGAFDFLATPFAVVIGTTSKDPAMRALCEERARTFVDAWRDWQKQEPRVFRDTEISDADLAKYSLLLIGGPADNRAAARLARGLPVRVTRGAIYVDGHEFRAQDAVVQVVYPNPRNAQRYVWLIAAASADGMYFAEPTPYGLPDWDYLVIDGHVRAFRQLASVHQTRVASGMFDHDWRYSAALVREGDPAARAQANQLHRPAPGAIDAKLLDEYAGHYQLEHGPLLEVSRDGEQIVARVNGEEFAGIPQGRDAFYAPRSKLWVTFTRDASGKITGINGSGPSMNDDLEAKRVD